MPYLNRLKRVQDFLKENECDALLVENQLNIFYLTGLDLSAGKLLVHIQGAYLIVDNRYFELCEKISPFPVLAQNNNTTFEARLSSTDFSFIKRLAFDSETTSYKSYLELEKCKNNAILQSQGKRQLSLVPMDNPVKMLRSIKDAEEVSFLREAATLGSQGFDFLCSLLREGITEKELASELEIFWKIRGGKTLAFEPIIAFGANSSMPHYRAGNEKLRKGHSVLIDIGVNYRNYHSDMTRVIFFGKPDSRLQDIYKIVRQAQQIALNLCRPGTLIGELDTSTRKEISAKGYGDKFIHSLGHGIGLEIHELPVIKDVPPYNEMKLAPGMVITIEPGIYLPGVGGIRLEDTIVITNEGFENLTQRSTDLITI